VARHDAGIAHLASLSKLKRNPAALSGEGGKSDVSDDGLKCILAKLDQPQGLVAAITLGHRRRAWPRLERACPNLQGIEPLAETTIRTEVICVLASFPQLRNNCATGKKNQIDAAGPGRLPKLERISKELESQAKCSSNLRRRDGPCRRVVS